MAIDPDLYEKVTGRSPGDAQRRLGESLARHESDKASSQERREYFRTWVFFGSEGVLFHYLIERHGWVGVLICLAVVTGLALLLAYR